MYPYPRSFEYLVTKLKNWPLHTDVKQQLIHWKPTKDVKNAILNL